MSIVRSAVPFMVSAFLLTGCTSYRGTDRLSDRLGFSASATGGEYKDLAQRDRSIAAARAFGLRHIFLGDLKSAWDARPGPATTAAAANARLVNSGVALIQSNCNEYFNEMGRNQRNSAILRDLIAPVTAALTTAINLQLFGSKEDTNQKILGGFGLIGAAGTSALNIYDRRFLFDSDNIASVRSNTMNALSTNAGVTIKAVPADFVFVITRLQQIENYCTPAEILNNVRASIKAGSFVSTASGTTTPTVQNGAIIPVTIPPIIPIDSSDPLGTSPSPTDAAFIETSPR